MAPATRPSRTKRRSPPRTWASSPVGQRRHPDPLSASTLIVNNFLILGGAGNAAADFNNFKISVETELRLRTQQLRT